MRFGAPAGFLFQIKRLNRWKGLKPLNKHCANSMQIAYQSSLTLSSVAHGFL